MIGTRVARLSPDVGSGDPRGASRAARRLRALRRPVLALLLGALGAAPAIHLEAQDPNLESSPYLRIDPQRIVVTGPDGFTPCGECHTAEWEVWRETPHATGFDELHRTESAQDILQQMDLTVTKRQESLCMRCHYTVGPDSTAIAGVSCESCHGPGGGPGGVQAGGWIEVHNQWGEGVTHPDDETAEHRAERIAQSDARGMLRPSGDIYAVAANCYECHTVPNEDLVNRGGHSTGTSNFDLVERTNEIRHNFVHRQWGEEAGNREQTPERRRMLFVVGAILDYEFALRGLTAASAEGRYATSMGRRAQGAYRTLEGIAGVVEIPQVIGVLDIGADLSLAPDNADQLAQAADEIRALGQEFSESADGSGLAELDPYVAGQPLGRAGAAPPPPDGATDGGAAGSDGGTDQGTDVDGGQGGASGPGEGGAGPVDAAPELPGQIRSRPTWHEANTQYSNVGPGECGTCHGGAEEWWFSDPHSETGFRLFGEDPQARRIAELYGIGAAGMAQTNQICMSCHATVEPSNQALVSEGVSCESCHGAGSGYLEPHEENGAANPQLGMRDLKDASVRAQNCSRCHLISDERLLAAGHPSGADYDIAAATAQIEHWPGRRPDRGREERGEGAYAALSGDALQTAFASIAGARPIPDVEVVTPPTPTAPVATGGGGNAGGGGGTAGQPTGTAGGVVTTTEPAGTGGGISTPPVGTRSVTFDPGATPVDLELDPLPDNTEDLTPEELLLLVKQRLDRVYESVGAGN